MRLWTLHPKYLDAKGLVALWREALLAQKVLHNRTRGYKNHTQLVRFRDQRDPSGSIAAYLEILYGEAEARGYRFDAAKIAVTPSSEKITATRGQLLYEWAHLLKKLQLRAPNKLAEIKRIQHPEANPLFDIVDGDVEAWEKRLPQ
ncbi:MAG: pyrimidine dimer DNA glycosylase/endonuclease V [Acidobacteriota bacterium]|nr:pyrimidine dimer DNA glycosylase/endonuclease V [Acidobacteriota bacterium]